jgi:hypothetical protein
LQTLVCKKTILSKVNFATTMIKAKQALQLRWYNVVADLGLRKNNFRQSKLCDYNDKGKASFATTMK